MTNTADVWGTNENTPTGLGFVPIGNGTNHYTGNFNGENFTVNNLYINLAGAIEYIGLFGYTTGTISNIGVTNAHVAGNIEVGALIGQSNGTVQNAYSSGTVIGTSTAGGYVGGLIGWVAVAP